MPTLSLRARLTLWSASRWWSWSPLRASVLVHAAQMAIRRIDGGLAGRSGRSRELLQEELGELDAPATRPRETLEIHGLPQRPIAILDDGGARLARRFDGPALRRRVRRRPGGIAHRHDRGWRRLVARPGQPRDAARRPLRGRRASGLDEVARDQQDLRQAILVGAADRAAARRRRRPVAGGSGLRPITQMARRAASLPLAGAEDPAGRCARTKSAS